MTTLSEAKIKEAKKQATRLMNRLEEIGVSIQRSQALEGIAAVNNHKDWNHFVAATNNRIEKYVPISADTLQADKWRYTRDNDFSIVAMRSGGGKSAILLNCIADCLNRGETGIFIDLANGYSIKEIPESIKDKGAIVEIIVDRDGGIVKKEIKGEISQLILVSVNYANKRRFEISEDVLKIGFSNALYEIEKIVSDDFVNILGYILIDEFLESMGSRDSAYKLYNLINRKNFNKESDRAKVVFTSQVFIDVSWMKGFALSVITDVKTALDAKRMEAKGWIGYELAQFYVLDEDHLDEETELDLEEREQFLKNITIFVVSKIKRLKVDFVHNKQLQYFKNFVVNSRRPS